MDIQNMELRKFVAPEIVFGLDARLLAGRYVKNFGAQKVLKDFQIRMVAKVKSTLIFS